MNRPAAILQRRHRVVFWTTLSLVTILGVFALPLQFPPRTPAYSASYAVGFNNRIAALAAVFLSLATAAVCSRWRMAETRARRDTGEPMPVGWFPVASAAMLLFVGVEGGLALRTESFESDAVYFLTQLAQWSHFHLKLYRDLEFGYGPLLFAWPAAFQAVLGRFNVSADSAYLVSLAVLQIVGLGTAFYVVQFLPLRRSVKGGIFLALTIGAMRPSLGLNYTLFRFTAPVAALFFVTAVPGMLRQAFLFSACEFLMFSISPEIGIAFLAGVSFYAVYRACRGGFLWLSVAVLPCLSCLAFCAWIDRGYFYTMRQFAGGMLNMVVGPTPQILILLVSAVGLAPLAIAKVVRQDRQQAGALIGLYGASLALLPAALGLCDHLHTFFNGLGIYLLAFVALSEWKSYWSTLGVVVFVLIVTPVQLPPITAAFVTGHMHEADVAAEDRQVAVWEKEAEDSRIFAPGVLPFHVRQKLLADDRLQPDYFSDLDAAFNPAAEDIKLQEMRKARFVLAQQDSLSAPTPDDRRRIRLMRLGYQYRIRYAAYLPLQVLRAELIAHASPVDGSSGLDGIVLYRMR